MDGQDKTRQGKIPRLSEEELLVLARLAQKGDEQAMHRLYRMCGPLLHRTVAHYDLAARLREEWPGVAYLMVHRLVVQYDPGRGVGFFTYMEHVLAPAVWTWVRQQQKEMEREAPQGGRFTAIGEGEVSKLDERALLGGVPGGLPFEHEAGELSVEARALLRLALRAALAALPARRRYAILAWAAGHERAEIARELGISVDVCHKEIQRAHRALQEALRETL